MRNKNVGECDDPNCNYNYPYLRRHIHVVTSDGSYAKFITDKPKIPKVYNDDMMIDNEDY